MNMRNDTRILIITAPEFHIELFTQHPDDITDNVYPSLKMGKFRIRRDDNSIGERYFVSDLRDVGEEFNALLVHDTTDKETLDKYQIEPSYTCDRVRVYRYGVHVTCLSDVVEISSNGIEITKA